MEEGKSKKRACVDKVWNDNAFKIVNELILDGYQNGGHLNGLQILYRKRNGNGILKNSIKNETLTNELHTPVIR